MAENCPKCGMYEIKNDGMNGLYWCPNPECGWEENPQPKGDGEQMTESKYVDFDELIWGGKTTKAYVRTKDETVIGIVKWYPAWRRYCFFPDSETLYDSQCMKDISAYIDELMELRNKERA